MTIETRAPDIGVVKAAAKAIRSHLTGTAKIPHGKSLEIAANAFGFSSWHACRSHFDHLKAGVFSPGPDAGPALDKDAQVLRALAPEFRIMSPFLDLLLADPQLFSSGPVTVPAISAGRSICVFLIPMMLLGARASHPLPFALHDVRVDLIATINGTQPYEGPGPFQDHFIFGRSGKPDTRKICTLDERIALALLQAALRDCDAYAKDGAIDLDAMGRAVRREKLRPKEGEEIEMTFAIPKRIVVRITRACQVFLDMRQDLEEGRPFKTPGAGPLAFLD
jgi:hypothetical protein